MSMFFQHGRAIDRQSNHGRFRLGLLLCLVLEDGLTDLQGHSSYLDSELVLVNADPRTVRKDLFPSP